MRSSHVAEYLSRGMTSGAKPNASIESCHGYFLYLLLYDNKVVKHI
jgi:hypothetical protein